MKRASLRPLARLERFILRFALPATFALTLAWALVARSSGQLLAMLGGVMLLVAAAWTAELWLILTRRK